MPTTPSTWFKPALWIVMGLMTLSVLALSEIFMLRLPAEQAHLHDLRYLAIPHILCGLAAFLIGH